MWGYLPQNTKSILVISPRNVPRVEAYFWGMGVHVVTRSRHPVGFISDPLAEEAYITEKVKGWADSVEVMSRVELQHPQKSYAGMKSPSNRSGFLSRASPQALGKILPSRRGLEALLLPGPFMEIHCQGP